MHFQLEFENGLPIYEQIVRQTKFAIAQGLLQPGDHVVSTRDLAQQLAVNPNTVIRAYRDLQLAGILTAVRGSGLAVTAEAPEKCGQDRLQLIAERLRATLTEARQSHLPVEKVRAIVEAELAAWPTAAAD